MNKLISTTLLRNVTSRRFIINNNFNNSNNTFNIQTRSFHSSRNQLFLFENVFGKIKNAITGGDKETTKKEYPTNEKELQNNTELNLKQQQESPQTTTLNTTKTPEQVLADKIKSEKENEDYQKLLESGAKYDFNVFKEYLKQYASQITDKVKIDEIAKFVIIIDLMTPVERANPYVFHKNAFKIRSRLIKESNTDMVIFASLINTFNSAKQLHDVLGSFKRQGKNIPNSAAELPGFLKANSIEIKKELDRIKKDETRRL